MLNIEAIVIEGLNEAIIRDNVANPDESLVERAIEQLIQPFQASSYSRAQVAYEKAANAIIEAEKNGETHPQAGTLPMYTDRNAMIMWYTGLGDYKDATQIENVQKAERLKTELQRLESEIESHTRQRDRLNPDLETYSDSYTNLSTVIGNYESEAATIRDKIEDLTS